MESVGVSKFRENLLAYLKRAEKGERFTITSRGRELAVVGPLSDRMHSAKKALEDLRSRARVGDIVTQRGADPMKRRPRS